MIKWKICKNKGSMAIYFKQRMMDANFNSICDSDDQTLSVYTHHLLNEEDLRINISKDEIKDGNMESIYFIIMNIYD